jgi:UDP-glucose 4-epimerase
MACYLITGGCGFIGSHLADALVAAGHAIRVLDDLSTGTIDNLPAGVTLLEGSVADAALVRQAVDGIDGCFHLAAIASVQRSQEDLLGTHRTNLGGTLTLLDVISPEIPFVYASSAAVYGDCPVLPIGEDAPKRPQSAYGADKYAGEIHAAVATHTRGIPTAGLRFFNVYGPRQRPDSPYSGVVSIFADRIARGQTLTIHGDGGQTRDLVQVADVVAALVQAMARRLPGAPVFNVCTGHAISVQHLAATIGAIYGLVPHIVHGPQRTGEIRHSVGDPRRSRAALGLGAAIPLATGLRTLLHTAAAISSHPMAQARR